MNEKLSGCLILFEEIDEGGDAFEGCLAGFFDVDGEADAHADGATQVGECLHMGCHLNALSGEHRLPELHLIHSVVDKALQVVHLYDLSPEIGEEREGEVAVYDGLVERTLCLAAFLIDVYPLVVESCVGEHVDAVLVHLDVIAGTYFLTEECFKVLVAVDDNRGHIGTGEARSLKFKV